MVFIGPMMRIMIAYAENRKIMLHSVGGIAVDVVEIETNVPCLADTTRICVLAKKNATQLVWYRYTSQVLDS
jgi:hypothetical protein